MGKKANPGIYKNQIPQKINIPNYNKTIELKPYHFKFSIARIL